MKHNQKTMHGSSKELFQKQEITDKDTLRYVSGGFNPVKTVWPPVETPPVVIGQCPHPDYEP